MRKHRSKQLLMDVSTFWLCMVAGVLIGSGVTFTFVTFVNMREAARQAELNAVLFSILTEPPPKVRTAPDIGFQHSFSPDYVAAPRSGNCIGCPTF